MVLKKFASMLPITKYEQWYSGLFCYFPDDEYTEGSCKHWPIQGPSLAVSTPYLRLLGLSNYWDAPRLKSSWQMTARWPLYCTSVFTVGDQTFAQHIHFYTYCRRPYILNWNISYIIHVRLNETFTNKLQCSHYHRQLDLHLLVEDNWLLKHCDRAVAGD